MARDRDGNFTGNGREDGDDTPDDTPAPTRRTRDGDDSDDTPRPDKRRRPAYENDEQPKRGFPVWGWVLIAVGTLAALAVGGCVVVSFILWAGVRTAPTAAQVAPAKRTYTRDEFRALVMGKTEAEVLQAVGKPDKTRDYGASMTKDFVYHNCTTDPVTSKIDAFTNVHFAGGMVDDVSY